MTNRGLDLEVFEIIRFKRSHVAEPAQQFLDLADKEKEEICGGNT